MAAVKLSLPLSLRLFLSTLVIVMLAMLMAVPSRADDVTFFDTTDTVTASTTSSRITIPTCGVTTTIAGITGLEACVALISAPAGFVFLAGVSPQFIGEADGSVSDVILVDGSLITSATVTFLSDPSEAGIPLLCSAVGGCAVTEDGTVQLGDTITFGIPLAVQTTDSIFFQSDVNAAPPVPEPASLTLLGSGLLAIAGYARRRRLA